MQNTSTARAAAATREQGPSTRARTVLFAALLFFDALDAYSVAGIPFQWIVEVATIVAALYIAIKHRAETPRGFVLLSLFLLWSLFVTGANLFASASEYERLLPPLITTPYLTFVALRFVTVLSFIATIYIVWFMLARGQQSVAIRATVVTGSLIALAAIYIYVAETSGLPEPPRTRLGSNGEPVQVVAFSYAFHRALGTFREPSLLGAWLIVPLLLGMRTSRRPINVPTVLMGGALLLTGSLSCLLAIAGGLLGAMLVTRSLRNIRTATQILAAVAAALVLFSVVAVSQTAGDASFFGVIGERLAPIVADGGLSQSDRGYIFDYVARTPVPYFGEGLGNANILLSAYLHTGALSGFIGLYLNAMYSVGYAGVTLLAVFLITPVAHVARSSAARRQSSEVFIVASYLAWLILFISTAEELSVMFGVAFALLMFEAGRKNFVVKPLQVAEHAQDSMLPLRAAGQR